MKQAPPPTSHTELEIKLAQLEKELAESESEKLDLGDRVQALEERIQELTVTAVPSSFRGERIVESNEEEKCGQLEETLKAKDHYIKQMEQQLTAVQTESNKTRVRLKKKIKSLTAQLTEARQESSIAQLELKERNELLQDKLRISKDQKLGGAASPEAEEEDKGSKLKVILDLSAEVSEQAEKIALIEKLLKERDEEILQLRQMAIDSSASVRHDIVKQGDLAQRNNGKRHVNQSLNYSGHTDRNTSLSGSGLGSRPGFTPVETAGYQTGTPKSSNQRPESKTGPRVRNTGVEFTLQRQSTALSDSDSEWEMDGATSKIHSAPARVRVKSAAAVKEEKAVDNSDLDDKWSLATDDNDLVMTRDSKPVRGQSGRQKRRSALKTKLERERNERAKGLMGPSLAFTHSAGDQLTDSSCTNTPSATPRAADSAFCFTTTDVMTFAV